MSGIKWIQVFFILLRVSLHDSFGIITRPGDTVNLPCNISPEDRGCLNTAWFYQKDSTSVTVTVAEHGSIKRSELSKSTADRLRLESNCALTVEDVTADDFGSYTCERRIDTPDEQSVNTITVQLSVLERTKPPPTGSTTTWCCNLPLLLLLLLLPAANLL